VEACDCEQALRLVEQEGDVDLILLDLDLPGMDGFEGLRTLRAQHPEIAVVIVSASEEPEKVRAALEGGASGFIPKSASTSVTILLRRILALFRSRNEQAIIELALRQQLATYAQKGPKPRIPPVDRAFWAFLSQTWSGWKEALVIVQPETVVHWHRKGFRCTGDPFRSAVLGDLLFRLTCRPSFVDSRMRTAGALARSRRSLKSSA
jgi:CheY-like chemotaxis protein